MSTNKDINSSHQLTALDDLSDWKVHSDDTDIRGWNFKTQDGHQIGKVCSLIADTDAEKVRYLEVEIDDSLDTATRTSYRQRLPEKYLSYYGDDDDRYMIVPTGAVELSETEDTVMASPNLSIDHFSSSPRNRGFENDGINAAHELIVARHYTDRDPYYKDTYADNQKFNLDQYAEYPNIRDGEFYQNDLFSRQNYIRRHKEHMGQNSMTQFRTGMPRNS